MLKKKSAPKPLPKWYHNFNLPATLPDVKPVRTRFFLNATGITVVMAIVIYLFVGEWQIWQVTHQLSDTERQIEENEPKSKRLVVQYAGFQAEYNKFLELDAFLKSTTTVTDQILYLCNTLPTNVFINSLDQGKTGILLKGEVRLPPDQGSKLVTQYHTQLKQDKYLLNLFEPAQLSNISRNPTSNFMVFEILLKTKTKPKDAK